MAAVKEIKSRITLDGEQAFKQALREAGQAASVMGSEMRAVAAEYKETGDAQKYYAERSRILKQQIAQQEESVRALSQAVKDAESKWGANTAKANEYTIKLNNAKATLSKMKAELQAADREAEEFGRDSIKVGRQIENGIGDGAEEAQKSMKGLVEQMQADIGSIKGSMAFSVASSVVSTITNVVQGIDDLVSGGMDTIKQNTGFELRAELTGHDVDKMWGYVDALTGIVGEREEIMNALGSLMNTGLNDDDMALAIRKFKVYSAYFGEEAKFEDLAESFQETVATSKVTGKFSEDVGRAMGIQEDALNALLEQAETNEEKAKATLTYIASLTDVADEERIDKAYAKINEYQQSVDKKGDALAEAAEALSTVAIQHNKLWENIYKQVANAANLLFGSTEEGTYKELQKTSRAIELGEAFTGLKKKIWGEEAVKPDVGTGIAIWDQVDSAPIKSNAEQTAEEWAEAYASALGDSLTPADIVSAYWATDKDAGEVTRALIEMMQPSEEELAEISQLFSQTGVDAATLFGSSFSENMDTVSSNAEISGSNVGVALGNGLNTGLAGAYDTAASWANQINAVLGSIGQGLSYSPVYGAAGSTSGSQSVSGAITVNSILKLDGKTIYKSADTYAGRKASRLG